VLPDFIIVGSPRSGSTSLARYLGEHPQIYMAEQKEIHFFSSYYDRGLAWYESLFSSAGEDQLVAEATPTYLADRVAMGRLVDTLPGAKLVMIFRNPTDRAWSDYWMRKNRGLEDREFGEIVASEIAAIDAGEIDYDLRFVWHGLYDVHVDHLLSRVDRDQIHVAIFEELASEPETVYSGVCTFLGVDPEVRPDNLGETINPHVAFRSLLMRRTAKRIGGLPRRVISAFNTRRDVRYPSLDARHRTMLDAYFAPHIERLESIAGLDLEVWS